MNTHEMALYPVDEVKHLYATIIQLRQDLREAEARISAMSARIDGIGTKHEQRNIKVSHCKDGRTRSRAKEIHREAMQTLR